MKSPAHLSFLTAKFASVLMVPVLIGLSGCGGGGSTTTTPPVQKPSVTVSASPASITAGASATLTVAASNASAVTLAGSDGSSFKLSASGGTQSVTPAGSTTYTATASGTGGSASAQATVTVSNPAPPATVTLSASPTTINAGGSSTLTVGATNATKVTITGSDNSTYTLPGTGGTQVCHSSGHHDVYGYCHRSRGKCKRDRRGDGVDRPDHHRDNQRESHYGSGRHGFVLTVAAVNATAVTVAGTMAPATRWPPAGGTQAVTPATTTTYTATARGRSGNVTANSNRHGEAAGSVSAINHVIFMLQENHTFDNYFGMLNPYRKANGWNIGRRRQHLHGRRYRRQADDQQRGRRRRSVFRSSNSRAPASTTTSSAWLASYGDVNRYNFLAPRARSRWTALCTRPKASPRTARVQAPAPETSPTLTGERAMGYYDQDFLNYYYYMASQFAVSDRWFSPISSKSTPNRIATFTGGTTQGLVYDPGNNDHLAAARRSIPSSRSSTRRTCRGRSTTRVTQGYCLDRRECGTGGTPSIRQPILAT